MYRPFQPGHITFAILAGLILTATGQESSAKTDPFRQELRQAAGTQRGLDQKALKTLSDLEEMITELDYNRLQGSAVHKHVTHLNGVLTNTRQKYMAKAAKELQDLVYTTRESARKDKLDEVIDLQGMILQLLESVKNAKLAAGTTRVQHKFQMALGDQENALNESKRLIFDAKLRIPIGRSPQSLKKDELQRLKKVTGNQRMAEESLLAAIADLRKALDVQSKDDPETGKKLTAWVKFFEERDTAGKSKQASRHLLNNMVTQAMKTEQEVIDDISEVIGRMAGRGDEGAEGYRVTDFDQLKSEVEALAEKQKSINAETDKIVGKKNLDEAELRMVEARQHQLIDDTAGMRRMLSDVPLAKVATEQARAAMVRAEKKLAKKYPGDAQPHQKTAFQALSAAVLALASSTIRGDEFEKLDEEQLKRDTEAVTALIKGVAQLLAKQQPLRDKTEEVNKSGDSAFVKLPALGKQQDTVRQETEQLRDAERTTFELSEETVKIIELSRQTIGVGVTAMQRASTEMGRKRPGFAVQNQDMAIRQLTEASKLLSATEEAVKGKLKAARMHAKAIMMTKMAALEADMISQIDDGAPLQDVRNVQDKFLKELAEFEGMAEEAAEVKNALEDAQKALENAQVQMQQAMSPVGDTMQTAAQQLQMAALASTGEQAELLSQIASNELALARQVQEELNPEKLPGWDEMQQQQQDALVEMMDAMPLDTGAGPPADEAVQAMEKAMEELEKVQKKAEELIIPPVEEAKAEMLAAMSTMQTAATEQFQVAQKQMEQAQAQNQETQAAAKYREEKLQDELAMLAMPEAGPAEQGGEKQNQPPQPPGEEGQNQGPPGQQKEGQGGGPGGSGSAADLLEVEFDGKWTVDFAKRKRLGFEQRIQRALPVEYRGVVEGYFRRLAVEGSD